MKVMLNLNSNIKMRPQMNVANKDQAQTNPTGTVVKPLDYDTVSFTGGNPKKMAKEAEKSYKGKGWFNGDKSIYEGTRFSDNAKKRQEKYEINELQHKKAGLITHAFVLKAEQEAAIRLGYTTRAEINNTSKINMGRIAPEDVFADNLRIATAGYETLIKPHTNEPEFINLVEKSIKNMIEQKVLIEPKKGEAKDAFSFFYGHDDGCNGLYITPEIMKDFHGFFLPMITKNMSSFSTTAQLPFRKDVYQPLRNALIEQYENPKDGYELYSYEYGNWIGHTFAKKGTYNPSKYSCTARNPQDAETRAYIRAFLKAVPDVPGRTVLMPKPEPRRGVSEPNNFWDSFAADVY